MTLESLYHSMFRIRRLEEEVARIYPSDKIKSPIHLSIGQESIAVGVCQALQPDDVVFGTYRGHAAYLAKGGDINRMAAELYGKATGCCKGKGGSMHLIDIEHGVMGTSAVVGTTVPQALGYAHALRQRGSQAIVVSFFGDGAVEEGVWAESMNFAALKKLPILFVCENNFYAVHSHVSARQASDNICDRAAAFGIPARRMGNDVVALHETTSNLVDDLRHGRIGPQLIEVTAYRWKEHVGPNEDYDYGYRSREELEPWVRSDQIVRLAGMLPEETRRQVEFDVSMEIKAAFEYAEESPFPEEAELYDDVFAEG